MAMKSIEELQRLIEKKINGICEWNGDKTIYQPINYILSLGGKRIRPALCLMSANLFSDDIDDALYPAIAIEVFHNFSLMHDDIMDKAPIRRGLPTVHQKWNENVAILSGDAMLIQSYQLLMKTRPAVLSEIMTVFNQVALEVCEGQQMDMDFENRPNVSVHEYEEMIRLKTSVLLAGALKIGAIIGGADADSQEKLFEFGIQLGLSFQLWDDYLDVFGDEKLIGKQQGGDILADKKTFLLLRCLELANSDERNIIEKYRHNSPSDLSNKVTEVTSLFRKLGLDMELKTEAKERHAKALDILDHIQISDERKIPLRKLTEQLLEREF